MNSSNAQLAKAAVATAGVLGGAYIAYRLFKTKSRPVRQVVIPDQWTRVGKLTDIYIYPIKSSGPVAVEKAECTILGLKDNWLRDRVLMVVDSKNNFLNARNYPKLMQVKTSVQGSVLTLKHKDMDYCCNINLAEVVDIGKIMSAAVWGVPVPVYACGSESSEWFSRLLTADESSNSFQLVYYATEEPRKHRGSYAIGEKGPNKFLDSDLSALAEEVSYSLINVASLEDLNSRLNEKVSYRNFRPNFLIEGPKAFEEDSWDFIKIGDNIFELIKPCIRCIITTIDPDTGVRSASNDPLTTLKSYHLTPSPDRPRLSGNSPRIGVQVALRSRPGQPISLHDEVYVSYTSS